MWMNPQKRDLLRSTFCDAAHYAVQNGSSFREVSTFFSVDEKFNFIYCFCFSSNTSEPHHVETGGHGSEEEPVVLGNQRCRKEIRTPRYVTEPCILCQEQQEVTYRAVFSWAVNCQLSVGNQTLFNRYHSASFRVVWHYSKAQSQIQVLNGVEWEGCWIGRVLDVGIRRRTSLLHKYANHISPLSSSLDGNNTHTCFALVPFYVRIVQSRVSDGFTYESSDHEWVTG